MKKVILLLLLTPVFALSVDRIEINTASLTQLEELVGVGPVIAQRIIDDRPFSSVDDLIRVKGIGEKTLQKIKGQGLAYVSGESQQTSQQQNAAENSPPTTQPNTQNQTQTTKQSQPENKELESQTITYPDGIFINEVLPSPEGPDETDEWIELYNANDQSVNLSGWKLRDSEGITTSYIFPENTEISANGYLVLKRPETKIILNNEKDKLNLILPDEKIVDSVNYEESPNNLSYNKIGSAWQWSENLTPGSKNIITIKNSGGKGAIETKKPEDKKTLTAALSEAPNLVEENLNRENEKNPWLLFYFSLALIIISGGIILFIKLFKKQ